MYRFSISDDDEKKKSEIFGRWVLLFILFSFQFIHKLLDLVNFFNSNLVLNELFKFNFFYFIIHFKGLESPLGKRIYIYSLLAPFAVYKKKLTPDRSSQPEWWWWWLVPDSVLIFFSPNQRFKALYNKNWLFSIWNLQIFSWILSNINRNLFHAYTSPLSDAYI